MGERRYSFTIPNHGSRLRRIVSFRPLPFYLLEKGRYLEDRGVQWAPQPV
jgi:hypothetical protein